MSRIRPSTLGFVVAFVAAMFLLGACGGSATEEASAGPELSGYSIQPEPVVSSVTMPAANRDTDAFEFKAEPGKLLMVNFGFTNCPDVCPTTLADTRIAFNQLGERADELDFAFISVDPTRDSAEILTNYVEAFLENGIALRTDDEDQLFAVADAFSVSYFIEENDAGQTEVAHTAHIYIVDESGSIILTVPFGTPPEALATDLQIMLDREQAP